ncbi:hypothetical protein E4634_20140 [Mangrovimicrobium sediminis]|uniref:CheW-like domain-containing protein n=1 Tax=Mangrovimicrobium sediminis TaxID=2562682 RepID=A0A4Z0LUM9_9GAMM|nr:hypothetical protein [Haliea sp. SAOS-164]TGD70917.1 hypothetical protein E4634_20140 [Haliea sp. SAOS-164]
MSSNDNATLEIAALPLADGRFIAVPLLALAEVQQFAANDEGEGLGSLYWRGHELPVGSLDEFCGLPAPGRERHVTIGIFRGSDTASDKFRALAFCGLAEHRMVSAADFNNMETPAEGRFAAAAEVGGQTYLVPDLPALLYGEQAAAV